MRYAPSLHQPTVRIVVLAAGMALTSVAAATLAAPIRADIMGNAFLAALTNAGVPYSEPAAATALGESVCPMVFAPGGSFDAIAARVADDSGISHEAAGAFTLIAIATYCPAILGPLLSDRRPA
ncbi:DUF732 domain-containing protein [Mycobacterium conspicuum]|uniref:Putative lipoprotein LprJ n=1 Tax=Mycobacterium conspicuum TaxID=44010 RepID=A0A1X1T3N3_9MYCO|nr:DUF732 domain-containing protein [Mycobacterium conspicuum]ORV39140.1 hypothetical protein AWC00_18690 [Mycobacterium conspicuum]BBZ39369.1 putative lipoprotein LprJ [Mycobacterium conspicuum]